MAKVIELSDKNELANCVIYKLKHSQEKSEINDKFECRVSKNKTVRQFIHLVSEYFGLNVDSFYLIFSSYQKNPTSETKTSDELKLKEHDTRPLYKIGLVSGEDTNVNCFLLYEIDYALCVIFYFKDSKVYPLQVDKNVTGNEFYEKALEMFVMDDYDPEFFVLIFINSDKTFKTNIFKNDSRLLYDIGVVFQPGVNNYFEVLMDYEDEIMIENLMHGLCSPTKYQEIEKQLSKIYNSHNDLDLSLITRNHTPVPMIEETSTSIQNNFSTKRPFIEFRGLVNQGMTCYLNSLLQALYMTPEFKNALFQWKFDFNDIKKVASKSVAFQLQQIFLKLQTSSMRSIQTTDLTYSLGWDSREARRQHDLQEHCSVMFNTLENELINTTHFDLLNQLYQGKRITHLKCLKCGINRSKVETFLDLQIPIRKSINSKEPYHSLTDALNGYIQPELLEGDNQYDCMNCRMKCNASKNTEFIKFPYILMAHLLRFSFNSVTNKHIKLYDRFEFPQILNLNSFISDKKDNEESSNEIFSEELFGSGNKYNNNSFTETYTSSALCDENENRGIDFSQRRNNDKFENLKTGSNKPYIYDLYAIIMHSGNVYGGHYFAYIKVFETNQWYCFNDESVTNITMDDIKKSFGGEPIQKHEDESLVSSSNAYMLMYRQIHKEKNRNAMSEEEFPFHLKYLKKLLKRQNEGNVEIKEKYSIIFTVVVHLTHSKDQDSRSVILGCNATTSFNHLFNMATQHFNVDKRKYHLVFFNVITKKVAMNLNEHSKDFVLIAAAYSQQFVLSLQPVDSESPITPKHIVVKLFMINLDDTEENIDLNLPVEFEIEQNMEISDLSNLLYKKYNISKETQLHFAKFIEKFSILLLLDANTKCSSIDPDYAFVFIQSHYEKKSTLIDKIKSNILQFLNTILLQFVLPANHTDILQKYMMSYNKNSVNQDLIGSERTIIEDTMDFYIEHEPIKIFNVRTLDYLDDNSLCVTGDINEHDKFILKEKHYFKTKSSLLENTGTFSAYVDKRMDIRELKNHLASHINLPIDLISLQIYYSNNTKKLELTECRLINMNDFDSIHISYDLLSDQYCGSIYYISLLNHSDCVLTKLFDWIITVGTSVFDTKKQLLAKIKKIHGIDIPYERFRLRKKRGRIPTKCYLNGTWNHNIGQKWEMVVYDILDHSEYDLDETKQLITVYHLENGINSKPIIKSELEFVVDNGLTPSTNIQLAQMISMKLNKPENDIELGYTKDFNHFIWKSKMSNWSFDLFDENICIACRFKPDEDISEIIKFPRRVEYSQSYLHPSIERFLIERRDIILKRLKNCLIKNRELTIT